MAISYFFRNDVLLVSDPLGVKVSVVYLLRKLGYLCFFFLEVWWWTYLLVLVVDFISFKGLVTELGPCSWDWHTKRSQFCLRKLITSQSHICMAFCEFIWDEQCFPFFLVPLFWRRSIFGILWLEINFKRITNMFFIKVCSHRQHSCPSLWYLLSALALDLFALCLLTQSLALIWKPTVWVFLNIFNTRIVLNVHLALSFD